MRFKDLYKQIFITEADEATPEAETEDTAVKKDIADPADFDDVKPAPLPAAQAPAETGVTAPSKSDTETLKDYFNQLQEFSDKLNNPEGDSLQSFISKVDQTNTPFEGIRNELSDQIVEASKRLLAIAEVLSQQMIKAASTGKR